MRKIKVSCVSYLNSLPFLFGIRNHAVADEISLTLDHPAECAQKLISGTADVGLIPVAAIPLLKQPHEITSWCIGADGPVRSVALFSQVPLEEIQQVLLDFQSVTSNLLVRILAAKYWNISPLFVPAPVGYEKNISGTTAGVVIGDRALRLYDTYPYRYDLSGEWHKFTGLPFVFARWVSNQEPDSKFVNSFSEALNQGVNSIDALTGDLVSSDLSREVILEYLTNNLDYHFDDRKKQGMEKFFREASLIGDHEISMQP
jgi:chorismate dehydratase